ncbi:MAG: YifB family Mg chelatase-like AAA ATPase [Spirochaetaceae bacterium]|nr:YifB family Mg chelatase-like AAA ATPase [Spirochaetaceae bacterium]
MAYAPLGGDGIIIQVEADIRRGIPGVDISGLALGAVREARERVRAAFRNSGFAFPPDRVLINLAPAGIRKDGTALDLPIALAVMTASGLVPAAHDALMVLGELELSGRIRPVRGVLAAVDAGLRRGIRHFVVPEENGREAAILIAEEAGAASFAAPPSLLEAARALAQFAETGAFPAAPLSPGAAEKHNALPSYGPYHGPYDGTRYGDLAEVRGQGRYKRAMEIAAAGGHNLLVFGPPGAGKTMLARRMPSIMAPLEPREAVEVTRLHSLAGSFVRSGFAENGEAPPDSGGPDNCAGGGLITHPPFRSPHHSASAEGILGGGKYVRPGEISLANFGVLFLDEAPEFRINVLEALREPLEDRVLTISRAEGPVHLPADFQLIMAANPCPCGRFGRRGGLPTGRRSAGAAAPSGVCFCSPEEIQRYWRRFSGALLDRVEIRVAVVPTQTEELDRGEGESGAEAARRVARAVAIQRERFAGLGVRRNARMSPSLVERFCVLTDEGRRVFHASMDRLGFSGRAFHGCLRTARTIADLEGAETIGAVHILEAVEHRRMGEDPYDILSVDAG